MSDGLDTLRRVETPEGVELTLSVAGPLPRGVAWAIDVMIRTGGLMSVASVVGLFGEVGSGLVLLLAFALEWFYPVLFERIWAGATPGKRIVGLAAVRDDGTPVDLRASVLRNLLRFADFLPLGYLAGVISMSVSGDFKRLGDLAAGTVVIHRRPPPRHRSTNDAPPRPPPAPLTPEEQRAIIAFAERSDGWSEDRVEELAGVLVPALAPSEVAATRRLRSIARWLAGG